MPGYPTLLLLSDHILQNRRRAFQVLTGRLMDQKLTREMAERRATRKNLVSGADRSEKIRTYNYAQVRGIIFTLTKHI